MFDLIPMQTKLELALESSLNETIEKMEHHEILSGWYDEEAPPVAQEIYHFNRYRSWSRRHGKIMSILNNK